MASEIAPMNMNDWLAVFTLLGPPESYFLLRHSHPPQAKLRAEWFEQLDPEVQNLAIVRMHSLWGFVSAHNNCEKEWLDRWAMALEYATYKLARSLSHEPVLPRPD